jgi:hypothetical protein
MCSCICIVGMDGQKKTVYVVCLRFFELVLIVY